MGRVFAKYSQPLAMSALRSAGSATGLPGGAALFGTLGRAATALGPVGTIVAIGAAVASAGASVASGVEATYLRRQALLASSEFGAPDTANSSVFSANQAMWAGQSFNYPQEQAQKTAVQLAMAGVDAGQLGPGLANTFAMARKTGLGPDAIAPLTGSLMAQGGLSAQQVSDTYQRMIAANKQSGVAINRLVDDLKDLVRETGNASVNVAGLASVQKLLGPGINAGQFLAPAVGANGTGALAAAAMLGVSPDKFLAMQSQPQQLWNAMSGLVKRVDTSDNAQGAMVAEQVLQQAGLVDWTGISPTNQKRIIAMLRQGKSAQAMALATQSQQAWQGQIAASTEAQTSGPDRAKIALQNLWMSFVNGGLSGGTIGTPPTPTPLATGTAYAIPGLGGGQSYGLGSPYGGEATLPRSVLLAYAAASKKTGVPLNLLIAQGAYESNFNPTAVSPLGAQGIAQFMPSTLASLNRQWGAHYDPFNVNDATMAQARYDAQLRQQYGGNWISALNAYKSNNPNVGYGPGVMQMTGELDLTGKLTLDVVDNAGHVIGHATIDQRKVTVKHPADPHRKAAGATTHGPAHGVGHH